jgi:hypothetical protein
MDARAAPTEMCETVLWRMSRSKPHLRRDKRPPGIGWTMKTFGFMEKTRLLRVA